jgi:transmembrane protein TMEM174 (potassium channel)
MSSGRLEAFSDGVIAVVITIMVLNLHPPRGSSLENLRPLVPRLSGDLRPLVPTLSGYLLSVVFVALYWNNHHRSGQEDDSVAAGDAQARPQATARSPISASHRAPYVPSMRRRERP